jgi:MbtH protein
MWAVSCNINNMDGLVTRRYRVVVNHEEQYSIWAEDQPPPAGWREEGFLGTRDGALAHIATIWRDMRPRSLQLR